MDLTLLSSDSDSDLEMLAQLSDSSDEDETLRRTPKGIRRVNYTQSLDDGDFTFRFRLNKHAFNSLLLEITPLLRLNVMQGNSEIAGYFAYPNRPYLLTPVLNPVSEAEHRYNEAHIKTRNTIERAFGVWKRRFPVVALTLRLSIPNMQAVIIEATTVLHNICRNHNLTEIPSEVEPPSVDNSTMPHNVAVNDIPTNHRTDLINELFYDIIETLTLIGQITALINITGKNNYVE
ncbi:unnamed protein product [Parnassius apollo]|uniref:(apollo) hypothetical protein n=1 Tax=Parnassius apollo TaxID=110799 RepID=A0A8S3XK68_PARAO|nr:unnamed protein product [Parnassius apollo]